MTPRQVFEKTMAGEPRRKRQQPATARIIKGADPDVAALQDVLASLGKTINQIGETAMARITVRQPEPPRSAPTFEQRVEAIKKSEGVSGTVALQKARAAYPTEFAKWQSAGAAILERPAVVAKSATVAKATEAFETEVEKVMSAKQVGRLKAMEITARRHPNLITALNAQ
jgi:hypothetical protein